MVLGTLVTSHLVSYLVSGFSKNGSLGRDLHTSNNANSLEHIYRHHRRYRITEGSEEIQMRRVAQFMFGYDAKKKVSFIAAY